MSRQDIDPLADTLGPRYAYESDDEDETGLATISSGAAPDVQAIEISFLPPTNDKKSEEGGGVLIVASGAAGAVWARGAALGQQVGQVNVNKRAIGLAFQPKWADQAVKGTVLVSEALARLPVWAMSPYAAAVLARWKPSKVILLDAYSTATYIDATPFAHHEAPLRYLSTERTAPSDTTLSLFSPPNLLQSTTAAFLSLLALPRAPESRNSHNGLAILVPSGRAPLPTPQCLSHDEDGDPNSGEGIVALARLEDAEDWDPAVFHEAHSSVFGAAGISGSTQVWSDSKADKKKDGGSQTAGRRKRVANVDDGMYI